VRSKYSETQETQYTNLQCSWRSHCWKWRDITWPSRSPDLSACDFFLWEYLKSQGFKASAPQTVQELKHRIQQEVKFLWRCFKRSNKGDKL